MIGRTAVRFNHATTASIAAGGGARCGRSVDADLWLLDCFTTLEFLPQDYAVMSYYINNSPQSWFTTTVVAVKMLLDDEQSEDDKQSSNGEQTKEEVVVGKEMLCGAELMRNMGGKTQLVKTCATEQERVDVLRDVFGLVLTEEERMGITGSVTALPLL
jgi:arylamine N-acetyltransferase